LKSLAHDAPATESRGALRATDSSADLYHRLNVIRITAALRERRVDIPNAAHYLQVAARDSVETKA